MTNHQRFSLVHAIAALVFCAEEYTQISLDPSPDNVLAFVTFGVLFIFNAWQFFGDEEKK